MKLETLTQYLAHVFRDFSRNQDRGSWEIFKIDFSEGMIWVQAPRGVYMACVL